MPKTKSFDDQQVALHASLRTLKARDADNYRAAIVLMYRVASAALISTKKRFSDWEESDLKREADDLIESLSSDAFGFIPGPPGDELANFRALVVRIRSLELALMMGDTGGHPVDPNDAWRVTFEDEDDEDDAFLVPVPRRRWRTLVPGQNYESFKKRILYAHRLIPVSADGAEVTFHYADQRRPCDASLRFGGVLFEALKFSEKTASGTFVIDGVTTQNTAAIIETGLRRSHDERCFATILPELLVSPTSLEDVVKILSEKPFPSLAGALPPAIVIAGTWHETDGTTYTNTAHVLDGDGEKIVTYDKRLAYGGGRTELEGIVPGKRFPIIVTSEGLVALAICLDFCDLQHDGPYAELDVDFLLVPSCGDDKTMDSHIARSYSASVRHATTTFVVQQRYPVRPDTVGYVLLRREGPLAALADTLTSETWVTKFT